MGLYNFMPKFEPLILNGTKQYTIRGRRKAEDVPGKPSEREDAATRGSGDEPPD